MRNPILPDVEIVSENANVWGSNLHPAGCRICRQVFLVETGPLNPVCPNCVQGTLEKQPAQVRHAPPELLVPFRKGRAEVQALLTQFVKGVWLRPADFNPDQLLQRIRPVFWPMWLVDSQVRGDWQAEIGYDYQVKSSRESYVRGDWVTSEVIEGRIRWEPRLGWLTRRYDNIPVPALEEHQALKILLGQYDQKQAKPFTSADFRNSWLRLPDLAPEAAWPLAQAAIKESAAQECSQAAAGQHVRNFAIHAEYENLNWTLLLLPLYATYYTADDGNRYPVYINGQTGTIGGVRLASQRKGWLWGAGLAGAGLLFILLAVFLLLFGAVFPPAVVLGGLAILFGVVLAAAGLIPVIWPWQWNRNQQNLRVTRK